MATYPGPKVHRVSRRHIGRGQAIPVPSFTVAITDTADTAALVFSVPVVVSGPIAMTVSGSVTVVSQTVVGPKTVNILYSGPLTTLTYAFAGNQPNVTSFQGGRCAAASGTFT